MKWMIFILPLMLFACKPSEPQMTVVQIRGCEYVLVRDNHGISVTHAGDCRGHGKKEVVKQIDKKGLKPVFSFEGK